MVVTGEMLVALVGPAGPRAAAAAVAAHVKLARGASLTVEGSELDLMDGQGAVLDVRRDAFALTEGAILTGPRSDAFADDRARPPDATRVRWRLNAWELDAPLTTPREQWPHLRVIYLPLQVPLAGDTHLLATIVNTGSAPIDIATGVREAMCWADGTAYASTAGRTWNGERFVKPNRTRTVRLRLDDFPGIPREGVHEMGLDIVGLRSAREIVRWRGEPT